MPGVHTELARRVGRARDDLARFVRVAVAADNDWQAGKFGVPAHFDRGLELVEVDVQDPAGRHLPQSLRATLSHASPRLLERLAALGQLELNVVSVEQRVQGEGLSIEVAGGPRVFQQTRMWRWCSIIGALNRICGSRLASESSA